MNLSTSKSEIDMVLKSFSDIVKRLDFCIKNFEEREELTDRANKFKQSLCKNKEMYVYLCNIINAYLVFDIDKMMYFFEKYKIASMDFLEILKIIDVRNEFYLDKCNKAKGCYDTVNYLIKKANYFKSKGYYTPLFLS